MILKKTIFIASVDFPPHTDGISTVSGEIALFGLRTGIPLVCLGPVGRGSAAWDAKTGFVTRRFPGYEWGYLRGLPFAVVFLWVLLRYRLRTIFAMNIAYGGLLSLLVGLIVPMKYYLWGYGYEFGKVKNPLMRKMYRLAYLRAEKVFAISRFVRERLMLFGVPEEKIVLVFPGTDPLKFKPVTVPDDFLDIRGLAVLRRKKIILSVGRLVLRKGVDMVIRALPEILSPVPDAEYLVVGDGPAREYLESLARECGVGGRVHFAGRVPERDLLFYYNLCEVFAMPSREIGARGDVEGFGIVYLEANACGKPVVGGRSGGVADAVADGESGLLVNPESREEIAAALIRILSDGPFARRLGKQGRERVVRELNWESFSKKIFEEVRGETGDVKRNT